MVTRVRHSVYLFSMLHPSWSLMLHSVHLFSLSHPLWSLVLDTVSTYPPCHIHCGHSCVKVVSIPAILESIGINHLVGAAYITKLILQMANTLL